ncbi:MAG: heme d1 biosynthesis radical SAM protein NirJ1 [bacterium]|nr:MAG: heme d1 biosynthesis radical SAM protein NirJ1 [bacterium]
MLQSTELLKLIISQNPYGTQASKDLDSNNTLINRSALRFKADMPPIVVWNVNNQCNMTCPHCYSSAKVHSGHKEITIQEACQIIDALKVYGISTLILSGGEPLLREDLFDIIQYAKDCEITCHLSTNGSLITAEKAKKLKVAGIKYVGISVDGFPGFNDAYRGLKDAFDLAFLGTLNSKDAGLHTGIRMTVTTGNHGHVFPLLGRVQDLQIPRFYLSHLVYGGRGKSYSKNDLERNQTRQLMQSLFDKSIDFIENGKAISIVSGGNDGDGIFLYLYVKERFGDDQAEQLLKLLEKRGGNSAGEKMINIDHKGNVHPDQFWQTSDCGNILGQSLDEIFQSQLMKDLRARVHHLEGRCGRCCYTYICRGSHRERALVVYNNLWAEDPACYLTDQEIGIS